MRNLFGLLGLLGIAGMVFGILTIVRHSRAIPFTYENYGGPGPLLAGLILLLGSLYLRSIWQGRE
jgi:hypothetical protein